MPVSSPRQLHTAQCPLRGKGISGYWRNWGARPSQSACCWLLQGPHGKQQNMPAECRQSQPDLSLMQTVAVSSLPACPPAPDSPLPSSSLSIRASVPTVSSSPRHGVARPQSRSKVYTPSIVSCTPGGWGRLYQVCTHSLSPQLSVPVTAALEPSFLPGQPGVTLFLPYLSSHHIREALHCPA